MIKNLIFDMGGVILSLSPEVAWNRFESLGIKNARVQMGVYGQTGIFRQIEDGSISAEEFCRRLGQQAQEQSDYFGSDREPVFSFEQAQWAWCGYVKEVPLARLAHLLRLRGKYGVYLLSNTNPFLMRWAESEDFSGDGHPITYYFDQVYYSYRMKDYKPSHSIFETMLRDAGISAAESVFLDDGPRNVAAAREVGMLGLEVPANEDWMPNLSRLLGEHNS